MKKYLFIFFALIVAACSNKFSQTAAKVNYVSSVDGTITMRAIGIGTNKNLAISNAEINAFEILFFRGLPESEQKIALIGSNIIQEKQKYQRYFYRFYKDRQYRTFLMSSIPISEFGKNKSITVDVKINLPALRKDLEQNNMIRKFGY